MSINPVNKIIDAVAWAKIRCMLANMAEKAERNSSLVELAKSVSDAQKLIKDYPDVLPFEVRVTMRACELGLRELTKKYAPGSSGR